MATVAAVALKKEPYFWLTKEVPKRYFEEAECENRPIISPSPIASQEAEADGSLRQGF